MPTFFALIAQSVEHAAVNRSVTGSSPVWGAKRKTIPCGWFFLLLFYTVFEVVIFQLIVLCFTD